MSKNMTSDSHPIQVVVSRTGLSAHVIRIWEKRYGAVTPERTETNRRLYSDEQIDRLKLLRRLSETGHGIGYVAKLPTERLRKLLEETPVAEAGKRAAASAGDPASWIQRAMSAVKSLDQFALERLLNEGEVELGAQGALQQLIGPLARAIGEHWREGTITAAHEHFATAVIRLFLSHAAKSFAGAENAPALVVVTPARQLHELGALLVAAAAANLGWHVIYLGAGLGAADIAGAAIQNRARAVALSIVYPEDDLGLHAELERLRSLLPETPLIAGGRAMPGYRTTLEKVGAIQAQDLAALGSILDGLRQSSVGNARRRLGGKDAMG